MRQYIVVLDRLNIPGEPRVPDYEHVWAEYPQTDVSDCVDHLWRASIGVTHGTPIDRAAIDGAPKLGMVVIMGEDAGIVDAAACRERGIEVVHLPPDGSTDQAPMDRLMDIIDAFVARATG
jgi:lactate dehydrogenase-like 2-hydroxyacid dehydrogenase